MGNVSSEMTPELSIPTLRLPSKALLSFMTTKIWIMPSKNLTRDKSTKRFSEPNLGFVLFRVNATTGEKKLIVNDNIIRKSNDIFDGSGVINFVLEGRPCRLEILSFPGLSDYILYCENERIPSIMETHEPHNVERPKVCVREAFLLSNGIDVKATKNLDITAKNSNCSVHFVVVSELRGKQYNANRRFADFDELDCLIRSTFKGHHLYNNLPSLPSKCVKAMTDHYSLDFIEKRKDDLDVYMKRLVSVPHTVNNPDLMQFLGIPLVPLNTTCF